jgi:hypothetical protein
VIRIRGRAALNRWRQYENLRQQQVRGLWPDCLFGCDALSAVQVGFEADFASERGGFGEVRAHSRDRALSTGEASATAVARFGLLPDIFVPQVRVSADEIRHHLNALGIVEDDDAHSSLAK